MAELTYAEKTRLGSILRRIHLISDDQVEERIPKKTEHSAAANRVLHHCDVPAPSLRHQFRRRTD